MQKKMKKGAKRPVKKSVALVRGGRKHGMALAGGRRGGKQTALAIAQQTGEAVIDVYRRVLTDDIALGDFGLFAPKFSKAEETILNEDVQPARVLVKPTGQPYYPHPEYTKWFNRAFGRGGWALVPVSKPKAGAPGPTGTISVVQPYLLHVHGKPVAFAMGEQEYHPKNKEQSFGDAVESTAASALRRCAKRLGVGLELWDRRWSAQFMREHAVRVTIQKAKWSNGQKTNEKEEKQQWRLRTDPPFYGEVGGQSGRRSTPQPDKDAARHPDMDKPITKGTKERPGQVERLWTIMRRTERTEAELKDWLQKRFGIASTQDIKRKDYDFIVRCIEGSGKLPLVGEEQAPVLEADDISWDREPGSEG